MVEWLDEKGQYGGTWNMVTQNTPDSHVYELVQYEPLLRFAMDGIDILPNLAESWEQSPDGKKVTLNLRKGVKWADGAPFAVDDIIFWANDVRANKEIYASLPSWLAVAGEMPSVDKIDDYTVSFSYSNPAPFLARQLGYPRNEAYEPKHFLEQFHADYADEDVLNALVEERGYDTWARLFLDQEDYNTNPDVPMLFAWQLTAYSDQSAVYERNPYYWKVDPDGWQLPYIDKVVTEVAANIEVAQMKAFSAEAELQTFSVGQFPADTMILKQNADMGNYRVVDAPITEPNVCVFGLNLTVQDERLREIFRDKRFRIALSHAVNREDIRKLVYLEQPTEIRQCAPLRASPYYHEAAAQNYVSYDPDTANDILDEMGLTERDGDGFRLAADGQPIAFVIEIIGKRDDFIDAMELIADWWTAVGIKATAKATETSLYFERLRANELQAGVDYSGAGMFPILNPSDYIPVTNGAVWAPLWGLWYATKGESGEEPPDEVKQQLDLYEQCLVTVDEDERKALWSQIMDINAENLYHYGICDRAAVPIVVSNLFHNVPTENWLIGWETGNVGVANPCQFWKET